LSTFQYLRRFQIASFCQLMGQTRTFFCRSTSSGISSPHSNSSLPSTFLTPTRWVLLKSFSASAACHKTQTSPHALTLLQTNTGPRRVSPRVPPPVPHSMSTAHLDARTTSICPCVSLDIRVLSLLTWSYLRPRFVSSPLPSHEGWLSGCTKMTNILWSPWESPRGSGL